jgi:Uma2 family endonuclease
MSTASQRIGLSEREYLAIERAAEFRSEFIGGRMIEKPRSNIDHIRISVSLFAQIHAQLKDRTCEAHAHQMRVRIAATGSYVYPDILALCGEPQLLDETLDTLTNSQLVVEVLSPLTESYDRNEKFSGYRRLDSLVEYVLIAQDRVKVERYARQPDDEWSLTTWVTLDSTHILESIGCQVRLSDIYARVSLPTSPRS